MRLLFVDGNAHKCEQEARALSLRLADVIARQGISDTDLIGPAPCFVQRIRGRYRWHIVLRGSNPAQLLADLPLPMGWQVDVDPVHLL